MSNIIEFEGIKAELSKEGNLLSLNVTGDCEIKLNGEIIYSPQENKEYRFLPVNLVPFIDKYQEYIKDEGEQFDIDLYIDGKVVTIYVPKNKKKKKFIARYDTSSEDSLEMLQDEYDTPEELIEKYKTSYNKMNDELYKLGYKLKLSHSQNEFIWVWSDLAFDIKNFNEEEFIKVSRIVMEHDNVIKELYKKLC